MDTSEFERTGLLLSYLRPHRELLLRGIALGSVGVACQLALPWLVRVLIDDALIGRRPRLLFFTSAMLGVAAIGIFIFQSLERIIFSMLGARVLVDIQTQLARHMEDICSSNRGDRLGGDAVSLFSNDAALASRFHEFVVGESAIRGLSLLATLVLMIIVYKWVTLVALAISAVYLVPAVWFSTPIRQAANAVQTRIAGAAARVHESFDASRDIKAFNRQSYDLSDLVRSFTPIVESIKRLTFLQTASSVGFVVFWVFISFLYWLGGRSVLQGHMTLGLLGALITYTQFLRDPLAQVKTLNDDLQSALGAADRIADFLHSPTEEMVLCSSCSLIVNRASVIFEQVGYSYQENSRVLSDVTFSVEAGRVLALVGPSGSGKSTLLSLIIRLFDPTSGCIRIDGQNLAECNPVSIRENVSIVFQDSALFCTSIRENIRFGNPAASDSDVIEAAITADADSFISCLPSGYDTVIGERGIRLSGGQKQRLAIARALMQRKPILLLDEATSAVDSHSETVIYERLRSSRPCVTTFVVAHRPSTVAGADTIVVLNAGRVVDIGTHAQLQNRCVLYRELYMHNSTVRTDRDVVTSEHICAHD